MKKTFRMLCMTSMVAILAFFASSCKKNQQTTEFTLTIPDFQQVDGDADSRAYIDFEDPTWCFRWNAENEVMFYNINVENPELTQKAIFKSKPNAEDKKSAKFYYYDGDQIGATNQGHYFVFYPASYVKSLANDKDNYETFVVPAEQEYTVEERNGFEGPIPTVDRNSLVMATEIDRVNQNFQLQHIFGIMRLGLSGSANATVKRIEIIDNDFALAGEATMYLPGVQTTTFNNLMENLYAIDETTGEFTNTYLEAWNEYNTNTLHYSAQGAGNMITLNCCGADTPNGVALLGGATASKWFYITLRPGALIRGFIIKVYYTDAAGADQVMEVTKYNQYKNNYRIRAGYTTNFTLSDPEYYIQ